MGARAFDRVRVGQRLFTQPGARAVDRGGAAAAVRRRPQLVQRDPARIRQRRPRLLVANQDGCESTGADRILEDIVTLDAIVIGAGPAGLATSRELTRRTVRHVVLERGDRLGHTWANLYDSLVLHTGKHLSSLPGLAFPRETPLFPTRRDFLDYLDRYAATFGLPIETGADVTRVERSANGWHVRTRSGAELHARAIVTATGIVANPHVPAIPGRDRFAGRVQHSVEYRRPADVPGAARARRRRRELRRRDRGGAGRTRARRHALGAVRRVRRAADGRRRADSVREHRLRLPAASRATRPGHVHRPHRGAAPRQGRAAAAGSRPAARRCR